MTTVTKHLVTALAGAMSLAGLMAVTPALRAAQTAPLNLRLQTIESPASAGGSSIPQVTVSSRGVLLSWIERAGKVATLKFAERTATGWTSAQVAASGDNWFVNWADVPSVLRLTNGTLVAHWLQKNGGGPESYDVRLSTSSDNGKTWGEPFSSHHDGTKTEHGFVSMLQMPGGGLGMIWLDGRASAPMTGNMTGMDHGGSMSLRFAAFDTKFKQMADVLIDGRVCDCCPTTVAVTADGPIAAFRNRSDDEIRDIYVARMENGKWTEPKAAHDDGWKINACPVNGPALSARGRDVAIAWFTGKDNQNRTFGAFSKDAGRTFGEPIALDDGKPLGRVDIEMLSDGSALATWIESTAKGSEFRARRIEPSGRRSDAMTVAEIPAARTSGHPRVAMSGTELVFAWTEAVPGQVAGTDGALRVKTAVMRVQ